MKKFRLWLRKIQFSVNTVHKRGNLLQKYITNKAFWLVNDKPWMAQFLRDCVLGALCLLNEWVAGPQAPSFSPILAKTSEIARGQTNQSIALLELKYGIRNNQQEVFLGFKLELKLGD